MKNYIIFETNGRIVQTGMVPEAMFELQGDPDKGRFVMEGSADVCTDYVLSGGIVSRPACPVHLSTASVKADGVDEAVLWQVPAGASVVVEGPLSTAGTADGSNIRLTFSRVGAYLVRVELFPFKKWEVTINAV